MEKKGARPQEKANASPYREPAPRPPKPETPAETTWFPDLGAPKRWLELLFEWW
jgi:hypothetical protein